MAGDFLKRHKTVYKICNYDYLYHIVCITKLHIYSIQVDGIVLISIVIIPKHEPQRLGLHMLTRERGS